MADCMRPCCQFYETCRPHTHTHCQMAYICISPVKCWTPYTSLQINACTLYSRFVYIIQTEMHARTHTNIQIHTTVNDARVFMSGAWTKPLKANLGSTDNGTRIMLCVLKLACISCSRKFLSDFRC